MQEFRTIERLLDELARGYAVGVSTDCNTLYFASSGSAGQGERIASAQRLKHGAFARGAQTPLEHAALGLVKAAGFIPEAVLYHDKPEGAMVADLSDAEAYLTKKPLVLHMGSQVSLPLEGAEDARAVAFRDGGHTHVAVIIGQPEAQDAPLVRLHSSCLTGDLLGSLRCDCGGQLHAALAAIKQETHGVLLYLNQEGRGIGIANKLMAYGLQDKGLDTVDANEALGFEADERDFRLGAEILKCLKLTRIRLLSNNPQKQQQLEQAGITISARVPLVVEQNAHNQAYLETKKKRLGHLF